MGGEKYFTGALPDGLDDSGMFELDFLGIDDFLDDDDPFGTQDLIPKEKAQKEQWFSIFGGTPSDPVPDPSKTQELPKLLRKLPEPLDLAAETLQTKALPIPIIQRSEPRLPKRVPPAAVSPKGRATFDFDTPVRIHGHGRAVHVFIGSWSIRLPGIHSGRAFKVDSRDIKYWGLSGGPAITEEEREKLMWILGVKSSPSPWMRLVFYDEKGVRIRYGKDGKRKRTAGPWIFGHLHHGPDGCDHADRCDAPGL